MSLLMMSTVKKLKNLPGESLVVIAIRRGIEKQPAQTIKMIKGQIRDNKRLMTELIGEELVNEVSGVLFV